MEEKSLQIFFSEMKNYITLLWNEVGPLLSLK